MITQHHQFPQDYAELSPSSVDPNAPLPVSSCFLRAIALCLSFTFFGFFALTGPSACLFFHCDRHQPCPLRPLGRIYSPSHHIDRTGAALQDPSHLQHRQKQHASISLDRRNSTSYSRLFDSEQGLVAVCRTLCKACFQLAQHLLISSPPTCRAVDGECKAACTRLRVELRS